VSDPTDAQLADLADAVNAQDGCCCFRPLDSPIIAMTKSPPMSSARP
jgi:hypothetical protein